MVGILRHCLQLLEAHGDWGKPAVYGRFFNKNKCILKHIHAKIVTWN